MTLPGWISWVSTIELLTVLIVFDCFIRVYRSLSQSQGIPNFKKGSLSELDEHVPVQARPWLCHWYYSVFYRIFICFYLGETKFVCRQKSSHNRKTKKPQEKWSKTDLKSAFSSNFLVWTVVYSKVHHSIPSMECCSLKRLMLSWYLTNRGTKPGAHFLLADSPLHQNI